jgi:hypothetical protein
LACPSFKVTGRHCNSDAPDGPETNFRSEHTLDGTNGWIVNFYYGIAAKPSFYASTMKSPERFGELSVEDIPHGLPKAHWTHQA